MMKFGHVLGHMGMEMPRHTQETLEGYLLRGWEPGGFVTSMLAMDMERALYTADSANRQAMWVIGRWIVEFCPEQAWGSYEAVDRWCKDVDGHRGRWSNEHEKKKAWQTLKDDA